MKVRGERSREGGGGPRGGENEIAERRRDCREEAKVEVPREGGVPREGRRGRPEKAE